MAVKILYAEDTVDLSRAVCVVLRYEGFEVVPCYDGEQAAKALEDEVFDLAILDIMMPQKSGIDVLREMRETGDVTPVLLLTAKAEVDDRVEGLMAGADDYLPKPFSMKELVARVHSLTRRSIDYSSRVLSFGNLTLNAETYELKANSSVRLSHIEFELLRTFILNKGRALSTDFLLGRVWSDDDEADESAVALYVRYVRNKLDAIGANAVLADADGGYSLVEGEQP